MRALQKVVLLFLAAGSKASRALPCTLNDVEASNCLASSYTQLMNASVKVHRAPEVDQDWSWVQGSWHIAWTVEDTGVWCTNYNRRQSHGDYSCRSRRPWRVEVHIDENLAIEANAVTSTNSWKTELITMSSACKDKQIDTYCIRGPCTRMLSCSFEFPQLVGQHKSSDHWQGGWKSWTARFFMMRVKLNGKWWSRGSTRDPDFYPDGSKEPGGDLSGGMHCPGALYGSIGDAPALEDHWQVFQGIWQVSWRLKDWGECSNWEQRQIHNRCWTWRTWTVSLNMDISKSHITATASSGIEGHTTCDQHVQVVCSASQLNTTCLSQCTHALKCDLHFPWQHIGATTEYGRWHGGNKVWQVQFFLGHSKVKGGNWEWSENTGRHHILMPADTPSYATEHHLYLTRA